MTPKALNVEDIYELTPLQQELSAGAMDSVRQAVYRLQSLQPVLFERAFMKVIARHAVLRTSIHGTGLSKAVQVVHRKAEGLPRHLNWRGLTPIEQKSRLKAYLNEDRREAFNPLEAPMHRSALIRIDTSSFFFVWSFHPLILDHESALAAIKEALGIYGAAHLGQEAQLAPPARFRDHVVEVRDRGVAAGKEYWRRALRGFILPTPLPQGAGSATNGVRSALRLLLRGQFLANLRKASELHHVTIGTLLEGAWVLLLGTSSRRREVVFGLSTPSVLPKQATGTTLIGPLHHSLPLRIATTGDRLLGPWLKRLEAQRAEVQTHYLSPGLIRTFSEVPAGSPLFKSLVVVEPQPIIQTAGPVTRRGVKAQTIHVGTVLPECPLVLSAFSTKSGLKLRLVDTVGCLKPGGGRQIINRLRALLTRICAAAPESMLGQIAPLRPVRGASLVCLQPGSERSALFCVHPAGGTSLGYASLANRLGATQPLYAFEAQGLDGKQRPHKTIEAMAASYLTTLVAADPKGPYWLAGWSSGGLVAYEMARQLVARGRQVALLALFDTAVPEAKSETKSLGPRQVLRRLARQMGLDLTGRSDLRRATANELPALIIAEARASSLLAPGFDEVDLRRAARLYRIHAAASLAYVPPAYPGRITLFRAAKSVAEGLLPAHLGWDRLAAAVDLRVVPGNHNTLLREPNVQALAAELAGCLNANPAKEN